MNSEKIYKIAHTNLKTDQRVVIDWPGSSYKRSEHCSNPNPNLNGDSGSVLAWIRTFDEHCRKKQLLPTVTIIWYITIYIWVYYYASIFKTHIWSTVDSLSKNFPATKMEMEQRVHVPTFKSQGLRLCWKSATLWPLIAQHDSPIWSPDKQLCLVGNMIFSIKILLWLQYGIPSI